jgi:predicted aspartyl protease
MATFRVQIEIADLEGRRFEKAEALVDTGSTYTVAPAPFLEALGLKPHDRDLFELGDGRRVEMDIGRAWVRVDGRSEMTLVVFGEDDSDFLLGAYAREGLRLAVDPVGRRLVPVPAVLK